MAQAERQIPMSMSTAIPENGSALSNGKRGTSHVYIYNQLFSSFLFHCFSFVLFKYTYNISFLNFYSCKAAEDDELGPDGKRLRPGISSEIIEELTDCNAALSQQRKRRQVLYPSLKIFTLRSQDE